MANLTNIFERISELIKSENEDNLWIILTRGMNPSELESNEQESLNKYKHLKNFLQNIIDELDIIATEVKENDQVLISIKDQKLLKTCIHILISLGVSTCLIPGLGISLDKRCISAQSLPKTILSDEQKYEILVMCTDFLQRSYEVPVLKNIIITFHLSDYLAALIQLAFAPLKKPGVYPTFTMTQKKYDNLHSERQKYIELYDFVVSSCFQPLLMKELLVLQSVTNPAPPAFVIRVIAKEMSRRLVVPGGLISLIKCFVDSHDMDTGLEWKKIDMICRIVATKHGNMSECNYIKNIVAQLKEILSQNNVNYLAIATSCLLTLYEKYNIYEPVYNLVKEIFNILNYDMLSKCDLPGSVILTTQEIEHSLRFFQACTSMVKLDLPSNLIINNLYMLFLLRIKFTNEETKLKITNIILKCLEMYKITEIKNIIKKFLFGPQKCIASNIIIEEYEAGLIVKNTFTHIKHPKNEAIVNFIQIFYSINENKLLNNVLESCLQLFIEFNSEPKLKPRSKSLFYHNVEVFNPDENYAQMLHLLAEISPSEKVTAALKENPFIIINFVEALFLKNISKSNEECNTIALVLLNTVISNISNTKTKELEKRLYNLLPILKQLAKDDSEHISILCVEAITLITGGHPKFEESAYEKALLNIFDNLLPVRAHGVIEMTKLIDLADPETISKRHYVFCVLQEQLKHSDSYIYLSTINAIASLAMHCTNDVLTALCNEFLEIPTGRIIEMTDIQSKTELRMKIGDIIVKVTKGLGEMAQVHKTILLNTMLCACRDDDPLIRASALSNLAEIALVLNYGIGTIIYEVLLCVWNIIETDKAIECRRAGVMVITSLLKGLGKDMLISLKEYMLTIYRTLKRLYNDTKEDAVVRLHAQLGLEVLDDVVKDFIVPTLPLEKEFLMLNLTDKIYF